MSANVSQRSAQAEHARLVAKRDSINRTLGAVRNLAGIPPDLLERSLDLQQQAEALWGRALRAWEAMHSEKKQADAAHNDLVQQANRASEPAKSTLNRQADDARRRVDAANANLQGLLSSPNDELSALQVEADSLLASARALNAEATTGTSLEQKSREVLAVERGEFIVGRDFHRRQADRMLGWVGAIAFAMVVVVVEGVIRTEPNAAWQAVALGFGWRFVLLVLGGSLLTFVGRLYSQHSQQAVSYQDRLAGLDAAALVLHYGGGSRETLLNRFVQTYISGDGNAFLHKSEPTSLPDTLHEVGKGLESITKAVAPLVKAATKSD